MNLEERIALGVQFLDAVKPGWAGQIDTNELELSNPASCVLGQLYREEAETVYAESPWSGYTIGGWRLHDWLVKSGHYADEEIGAAQELAGFERLGVYEAETSDDTYESLQAAWMKVITTHV